MNFSLQERLELARDNRFLSHEAVDDALFGAPRFRAVVLQALSTSSVPVPAIAFVAFKTSKLLQEQHLGSQKGTGKKPHPKDVILYDEFVHLARDHVGLHLINTGKKQTTLRILSLAVRKVLGVL
jgi:hypothetical protein